MFIIWTVYTFGSVHNKKSFHVWLIFSQRIWLVCVRICFWAFFSVDGILWHFFFRISVRKARLWFNYFVVRYGMMRSELAYHALVCKSFLKSRALKIDVIALLLASTVVFTESPRVITRNFNLLNASAIEFSRACR